jgi:hypothetical protein
MSILNQAGVWLAANLPASLADVGLWLVVIFGCIILYNEICILSSLIRRWGQEK